MSLAEIQEASWADALALRARVNAIRDGESASDDAWALEQKFNSMSLAERLETNIDPMPMMEDFVIWLQEAKRQ